MRCIRSSFLLSCQCPETSALRLQGEEAKYLELRRTQPTRRACRSNETNDKMECQPGQRTGHQKPNWDSDWARSPVWSALRSWGRRCDSLGKYRRSNIACCMPQCLNVLANEAHGF